MNIFFLSICPYTCAKMHCDKHVRKMIIEYGQMLSTAHHVCGRYKNPKLYKISFKNNPCTVWARTSSTNYLWLYILFKELCKEFEYRFGKKHASQKQLEGCLSFIPLGIPNGNMTKIHQAMPEYCKHKNPIKAYHNYYNGEKTYFATWTSREIPHWYKPITCKK